MEEEMYETAASKERSRRIKSYGKDKDDTMDTVTAVQEDQQEEQQVSDQESIATVEQNIKNVDLFNLDKFEMLNGVLNAGVLDDEEEQDNNDSEIDELLLENFDDEEEEEHENDEEKEEKWENLNEEEEQENFDDEEIDEPEHENENKKEDDDDDEEEEMVQDVTQHENEEEDQLQDDQDEDSQEEQQIIQEQKEDTPQQQENVQTDTSSITDSDILSCVETLFEEADKETMTVKDIINSVKEILQIKIKGERKALVKNHLMKLVNGEQEDDKEEEHDEQEQEQEEEEEKAEESEYDASEDEHTPKRPTRTKKQRKPSHLKIHHESMRKRQLEKQKIIQEELQQNQIKKISQADRERAEAIAKKFQTDSEELRLKRAKERLGLIDTLVQKRLMLLNSDGEDSDDDSGNSSDASSDCDSDDELEILGMDSNPTPTEDYEADSEEEDMPQEPAVKNKESKISPKGIKRIVASPKKNSPQSIIAFFSHSTSNQNNNHAARNKVVKNPRALLKHALKAKQFENGNKWLARYVPLLLHC